MSSRYGCARDRIKLDPKWPRSTMTTSSCNWHCSAAAIVVDDAAAAAAAFAIAMANASARYLLSGFT